jgi:hypothetical protein
MIPSFSLRALAITLGLLVFGVAATASNHWLGAGLVILLHLLLLCLALGNALVLRGGPRVFWIGFAVFGWGYWLTAGQDSSYQPPSPAAALRSAWNSDDQQPTATARGHAFTALLMNVLETMIGTRLAVGDEVTAQYSGGSYYPGVIEDVRDGQYLVRWTDGSSSPPQWTPPGQIRDVTTNFRRAAEHLLAAVWALMGGILLSMSYRTCNPSAGTGLATRSAPASAASSETPQSAPESPAEL